MRSGRVENSQLIEQSRELITKLSNALELSLVEITEKTEKIKQLAPLASFGQSIITSKRNYSWADASKLLGEKLYLGKQLTGQRGRNKMVAFLRKKDVLRKDNTPYQEFINRQYFTVKLIDTDIGPQPTTRVTGKGLRWLLEKLIEWEYTEWLGLKDKA